MSLAAQVFAGIIIPEVTSLREEKPPAQPIPVRTKWAPPHIPVQAWIVVAVTVTSMLLGVIVVYLGSKNPVSSVPPGKKATEQARFDPILSAFGQGIAWSPPVAGELGFGLVSEHRGRRNVLTTHPVSQGEPFILRGVASIPSGKKSKLVLDVSNDPRGDWQLVVKANRETLYDASISQATTNGGWLEITVDLSKFAGTKVNLDILNKASGWTWEVAFWSKIAIVSYAEKIPASDSSATASARQKWVHPTGYFVRLGSGAWQEQSPAGYTFTFIEATNTSDYIEMINADSSRVRVKLYKDRCDVLDPRLETDYKTLYRGHWIPAK